MSVARDWAGRPLAALVASALLGATYGLLFPDRPDYLGHLLAGAGGTFVLLAAMVARVGAPIRPLVVVASVACAVLLGASMEASVFRLAVFDPVDLANQSIGAVVAGIGLHDTEADDTSRALALLGGLALLAAGFFYAYA